MDIKENITTLIVEDHDLASQSIIETLKGEKKYCFDIKQAIHADQASVMMKYQSFDLIILDLILKNESAKVQYQGGDDLLHHIRNKYVNARVIVLSKVESIDMLDYIFNVLGADGYILKSSSSLKELIPAIETVFLGDRYLSPGIEGKFSQYNSVLDMDYRDRITLKGLSQGASHQDIVLLLSQKGINVSKSAVEKRIRKLKERFAAKTTAHLIAIVIEEGLI